MVSTSIAHPCTVSFRLTCSHKADTGLTVWTHRRHLRGDAQRPETHTAKEEVPEHLQPRYVSFAGVDVKHLQLCVGRRSVKRCE